MDQKLVKFILIIFQLPSWMKTLESMYTAFIIQLVEGLDVFIAHKCENVAEIKKGCVARAWKVKINETDTILTCILFFN